MDHQFFTVIKIFFSNEWRNLQLLTIKPLMDEHSITQATKTDQVFLQK
jgi:hypothetical protein